MIKKYIKDIIYLKLSPQKYIDINRLKLFSKLRKNNKKIKY